MNVLPLFCKLQLNSWPKINKSKCRALWDDCAFRQPDVMSREFRVPYVLVVQGRALIGGWPKIRVCACSYCRFFSSQAVAT